MSDSLSSDVRLTWADMFAQVCKRHGNRAVAEAIGYSVQYVSDLRRGMRTPSVEVTNKVCDWMGRGPKGRLDWHQAGARAHGWNI